MKKTIKKEDIARIFEDVNGYFVCGEADDFLDARGRGYRTKTEAQRAAAESGYTHMIGSGTPKGNKVQAIPAAYRR